MTKGAYYNEFNPENVEWLKELIKRGLIAPGDVDGRSITDVHPDDLKGYTQHHFFSGIGVWSYALRNAGWIDDLPVCTASLPCQSFSTAGLRKGFDDERHLFPVFYNLTKECRFPVILGEQVSSKDGLTWFHSVQDSMEAAGYLCGALDTCAAGVGAPHIRQRLYWSAIDLQWLGHPDGIEWLKRLQPTANQSVSEGREIELRTGTAGACHTGGLGDSHDSGLEGYSNNECDIQGRENPTGSITQTSSTGYWNDAEWVRCRDKKFRPIKPGISPLVDGTAGAVGVCGNCSTQKDQEPENYEAGIMRIHGYGNAICAPAATMFISCVKDFLTSDLFKNML